MRRARIAALAVGASVAALVVGVTPAWASPTLCVGSAAGCYQTLAAALSAAPDGSRITIGPGTFAGGVVIDKNVSVVGAGAGRTIIKGGGPVITVGQFRGPRRLDVSISRLTVTGGLVTDHPGSAHFWGQDGVLAAGAGIEIAPTAGDGTWYDGLGPGAKVTITDAVITQNRASASSFLVWDEECGHDCSFGWARGGGVDSWGDVTLVRSTVSANVVDGLATDATGGGIQQWAGGSVTLVDSVVSGNKALAVDEVSRFAEGGGVMVDHDADLTALRTAFRDNVAELRSALDDSTTGGAPWDMNANGGGVHVSGGGGHLMVQDSVFTGNVVDASDTSAQPAAFDAALSAGSSSTDIERSVFSFNSAKVVARSSDWPGASGDALSLVGDAKVTGITVTDNTSHVTTTEGPAIGAGAVFVYGDGEQPVRVVDSVIARNTVTAKNPGGEADVWGGGMLNAGKLDLHRTLITRNVAAGFGSTGAVQGGGIWNASFYGSSPELSIDLSMVTKNVLTGSPSVLREGGGLYTTVPVTITRTIISRNSSAQCAAGEGAPLPC